jgi:hypothetical protein
MFGVVVDESIRKAESEQANITACSGTSGNCEKGIDMFQGGSYRLWLTVRAGSQGGGEDL